MKEWYFGLPKVARVASLVIFGSIALVALLVFYDWVGTTFLDSGGTVG